MQKESRVIFMILLGVLLAVAVGINFKLRVTEALSNIGENKPKNNGNGNASKKTSKSKLNESYKNVTDYLGDAVSILPRGIINNNGPKLQSTEGMINLGKNKKKDPSSSEDTNSSGKGLLSGSKIGSKKQSYMSQTPTSEVYTNSSQNGGGSNGGGGGGSSNGGGGGGSSNGGGGGGGSNGGGGGGSSNGGVVVR